MAEKLFVLLHSSFGPFRQAVAGLARDFSPELKHVSVPGGIEVLDLGDCFMEAAVVCVSEPVVYLGADESVQHVLCGCARFRCHFFGDKNMAESLRKACEKVVLCCGGGSAAEAVLQR